jgi:hypothetical protein
MRTSRGWRRPRAEAAVQQPSEQPASNGSSAAKAGRTDTTAPPPRDPPVTAARAPHPEDARWPRPVVSAPVLSQRHLDLDQTAPSVDLKGDAITDLMAIQ